MDPSSVQPGHTSVVAIVLPFLVIVPTLVFFVAVVFLVVKALKPRGKPAPHR